MRIRRIMPYINKVDRNILNPHIKALAKAITHDVSMRPGQVNYAITAFLKTVYGVKLKYAEWAEIVAALECAKLEMYRAEIAPYEDRKIQENGLVNPL
jgi:hypothetical protein